MDFCSYTDINIPYTYNITVQRVLQKKNHCIALQKRKFVICNFHHDEHEYTIRPPGPSTMIKCPNKATGPSTMITCPNKVTGPFYNDNVS